MKKMRTIKDAILGFVVGDALGVPYEFVSREEMKQNPATDMIGFGTYNQPVGTWSDDTSMTLCVIENIIDGGTVNDLANLFIKWYKEGYNTATNVTFDIGNTTKLALDKIIDGCKPSLAGATDEYSAGNGSLMRSTPYGFLDNFYKGMIHMRYRNRITHNLPICYDCCLVYSSFLKNLRKGKSKDEALTYGIAPLKRNWRWMYEDNQDFVPHRHLDRIMDIDFGNLKEHEIKSSGYVVHTLEAAIWCFLNTENYEDAVLKAVNLGGDTDTIAAITGAMAGTYYGFESIPKKWLDKILKIEEIESKLERFNSDNGAY